MKPKVIALYLPQYHPTPDNDRWWGKGFTEWTNVGKAKPLFRGHYQPKVPSELGYYDLRLSEVREAQAQLAREAGVYGFCYYHYWFGNGKQELELPFNIVLKSREPDFPFCLCWANESWHSKFWNIDGTIEKKILIEQKYLGEEDDEKHFYSLLPAFKDNRYIRYNGKPLFMIYKPFEFENIEGLIRLWNKLALKEGLPGIHFVAHLFSQNNQYQVDTLLNMGFDAVNSMGLHVAMHNAIGFFDRIRFRMNRMLGRVSRVVDYSRAFPLFSQPIDINENVYPTLIPNWDHTPRSGKAGTVLKNSTPELFAEHCRLVLRDVRNKNLNNQIVFLKSWNEWGEGNYMEPDLKYGKGYINALSSVLTEFS